MQRVVVFGGSGFIGRALVKQLSLQPDLEIISFGRRFWGPEAEPPAHFVSPVTYQQGNFDDLSQVTEVIQPQDIVFDLVTSSVPFTSMQSPIDEVKHHVFAHVQFIEEACRKNVKQIIFTSSGGGVYGEKITIPITEEYPPHPVSPHAISKVTIEYFLQYFGKMYGIPNLVYRLSNPYGPHQHAKEGFGIIPILFQHIKEHRPPTLFNHGQLVRDFIFIDDLVEAMILPLSRQAQHRVYNIGSGVGTSLQELWLTLKLITGTELEPIFHPKRPIDVESIILNTDRFRQEFSWQPQTSLYQGLQQAWQSYLTYSS